MRPLQLHLEAFGSFAGHEHVDFEALAPLGLFLVTGPTGSGKTTIFDAVVFALYGTVPGSRRAEDVHSQHAPPGSVPRVVLDFEAQGERWRVERTARHERPVRRGQGTTVEQPTAALSVWRDGGWRPLLSGVRDVTERVTLQVGLDAEQFQRVVLLPQGQFEQFLVARSDERKVLLRQLFGSEVYERLVDELRRQAADARHDLDELEHEVEREVVALHRHLADAEQLLDVTPFVELDELVRLQRVRAATVDAGERRRRAATIAADAQQQLAAARQIAQRWSEREQRREEQQRLLAEADAIAVQRERLDGGRRARSVRELLPAVRREADRHTEALARWRATLTAATELGASIGVQLPAPGPDGDALLAAPAVRAARRQLVTCEREVSHVLQLAERADDSAQQLETARRHAADADTELERARRQLDQVVQQAAGLRIELTPLTAAEHELPVTEAALVAADERLAARRSLDAAEAEAVAAVVAADRADAAYGQAFARFAAGAAPRLAEALVPGEPCPVCGAVEHPNRAMGHDATTVTAAQLDRAREHAGAARARRDELVGRIAAHRDALGEAAIVPLDDLVQAAAHAAAVVAERGAMAEQARQIGRRLAALDRRLPALHEALAAASAAQLIAAERLAATVADSERVLAELGDAPWTPEVARLRGARAARLATLLDELEPLGRAVAASGAALTTAEQAVQAALADGGWDRLDHAQAAVLGDDDLARLVAAVEGWDTALAAVEAQLRADDEVLTVEPPDVVSLQAFALAGAGDLALAEQRANELAVHVRLADEQLQRVEPAQAALGMARSRAQVTADAFERCAGQLSPKVSLESWVLGTELDRVVEAANEHLAEMTAGRYRLARVTDTTDARTATGLDLVVDDAYTGNTRRTASLSGGERFQASLALALGLADVVTSGVTATARTLDALFVDEGFGSLDSVALDQAMSTLDRLRVHGRQIGVITHVEAMQAVLPVGIEVERLPGDGGSRIRQRVLAG